ncbi:xylulokinase, partial [Albidovulum sp.]
GLPVFAGGGDAATGAVSLGATEPGRGFVSLGTSGQLFVAGDSYRPNPARFVHAFAHTLAGRWFQMAAMLNGARPISWLGERLEVTPAGVVALAAAADAERVPLFLPYLTGERSPHGDPHIRAAFYGLDEGTGRAEICRAVVEAIAFSFADAAESFGATLDEVPHLTAIGGGARADLLLQMIADTTGKTLLRGADADVGPALGAARLAAHGAGAIDRAALAREPEAVARFLPAPDPRLLARRERFRALYAALRGF